MSKKSAIFAADFVERVTGYGLRVMSDEIKNNTDMTTAGKVITWSSVIAVIALAGFIFFKFCFVYSEGVN